MKAVGLITEYNPFHNGHQYHLNQAKALTGADVVVAVMSGNYVQRGVPAIFDKWTRAELALVGGVDLVFELPFAFAVQPAHIFARGAVQILAGAGVETIVFGAEHAELDFLAIAEAAQAKLQLHEAFTDYGQTYATAYHDVIEAVAGQRLSDPNDLLGLAYATTLIELGLAKQMTLQPIQRVKAGYHDTVARDATIASATTLRQLLAESSDATAFAAYTSPQAAELLAAGTVVKPFESAWYEALRLKVLTTPVVELERIYQLTDGLAYRLVDVMQRERTADWETFMTAFKTKRYTWARLQRALLYTLLNITNDDMTLALNRPYLRSLGSTPAGRRYLKVHRETFTLPVINRVDKAALAGPLALDYRAGLVYQAMSLPDFAMVSQDTGRIPVFYD
jgi:predicted nucleotidyltransferase